MPRSIHKEVAAVDREISGEKEAEGFKGSSLEEMRMNAQQSALFGEYLEEQHEEELGERFLSKTIENGDIGQLAQRRSEFLELKKEVEEVMDALDANTLLELTKLSVDLHNLVAYSGVQKIRDAVGRHLMRLAIHESTQFESLAGAVATMKTREEAMAQEEKEADDLLKKHGISREECLKILKTGSAEEAAKRIHGALGFFEKRSKPAEGIRRMIEGDIQGSAREIRESLAEQKEELERLGDLLAATFLTDETLRKDLLVERQEPEPKMSMQDADALRKVDDENAVRESFAREIEKYNNEQRTAEQRRKVEEYLATDRQRSFEAFIDKAYGRELPNSPELEEYFAIVREESWRSHLEENMAIAGITSEEEANLEVLEKIRTNFNEHYKNPVLSIEIRNELIEKIRERLRGDQAWQARVRQDFENQYTAPDTAQVINEVNAEWQNITEGNLDRNIRADLVDDFVESRTREHMAGKKNGLWSTIASNLFKGGLFDIFTEINSI
jgi:hypothetical protein